MNDRSSSQVLEEPSLALTAADAQEPNQVGLRQAVHRLKSGQVHQAVYDLLQLLAEAREHSNAHDERLALQALSLCYTALGRSQDADKLAKLTLAND